MRRSSIVRSAWVVGLIATPLATHGQVSAGRRQSVAVAGLVHVGEFGGINSSGFGVAGLTWLRLAPIVALRGDVSYAVDLPDNVVCVFNPCQYGLSKVTAIGVSAKVGNLLAPSTRPYLVAGAERLSTQGGEDWDGRSVVVPKLGVGALFPSVIVELSGRWRNNWDGWRVRHVVLLVGRYW